MIATAVVPTIGASPWLAAVLEALRSQEGVRLGVVLVGPGEVLARADLGVVERVEVPSETGFAAAANRGLAAAGEGDWTALVNDDAIPAPDWAGSLAAVLDRNPAVGAVQGLNLDATGAVLDGAGIAWNRWWQAVQPGRGRPAPGPGEGAAGPIAGASGTGLLLRRSALAAVSGPAGAPFDERLDSWYEDVDLALRLRAAGASSWLEPAARLRHLGSASGAALGVRRFELLYGNRWLVLARHLGRTFPRRVPRILARDLLDRVAAQRAGDRVRAAGIRLGWARARRLLPDYRHRGAPTLGPGDLLPRAAEPTP